MARKNYTNEELYAATLIAVNRIRKHNGFDGVAALTPGRRNDTTSGPISHSLRFGDYCAVVNKEKGYIELRRGNIDPFYAHAVKRYKMPASMKRFISSFNGNEYPKLVNQNRYLP